MDDKNDKLVLEFQKRYKEAFGEELPYGEADMMLTQMAQFVMFISRPLPPEGQSDSKGAMAP